MTYGMSDELRNSDLLSRISVLSLNDKQCLIRYIAEEVDQEEEDPWETQDTSDLEPYTLDDRRLHKVGIAFSTEARTLTEWKISPN